MGRACRDQVKAVVGGTTTYYVGAHYQVDNGVVTKYYLAGATRVAMRKNDTLYYMLTDHLGSTSLTLNSSGSKIAELRYKAWGETRYTSGTTYTAYHFTAQRNETSLGLYFYNARWYDSQLGRFAQADTIIPEQTQGTQAWDRFAYTLNNPLKYTDPSGHVVCDEEGNCYNNQGSYQGARRKYEPRWKPFQPSKAPTPLLDPPDCAWPECVAEDGNSLPSTIVMHPLDGNVVNVTPVYAYHNGRLVIIGYEETFYAYDYSTVKFDPGASGTIPWLIPAAYEAIKWGMEKAGMSFACPWCSGGLWTLTVVNGINDSTTIEGHLQERFYYAVRHDFYSPDYNPFSPTYDPYPWWDQ